MKGLNDAAFAEQAKKGLEVLDVDTRIARICALVSSAPDSVILCEQEEHERQRMLRAVYYAGYNDGRSGGIKAGFNDAISALQKATAEK